MGANTLYVATLVPGTQSPERGNVESVISEKGLSTLMTSKQESLHEKISLVQSVQEDHRPKGQVSVRSNHNDKLNAFLPNEYRLN